MALIRIGQLIQHPFQEDVRFEVTARLGVGGFGEAYEVVAVNPKGRRTLSSFCLKVTTDERAWHGETYFMRLLEGQAHAMPILASFPIVAGRSNGKAMRFAIVMPRMGGTVSDACDEGVLPWKEDRVARQLRYLLKPLGMLHRVHTPHRDITPPNIFIGNKSSLILGDYGIAKTASLKRGVRADALNEYYAPPDLKTFWDLRDDVYQVGLLGLTLLSGEPTGGGVKKPFVNQLTSRGGGLREVIKLAISVKSQRFADASAMRLALDGC